MKIPKGLTTVPPSELSTMALDPQGGDDKMAVVLRNARKSYDKGKTQVLDNLNMCIPRGCIYGLLGASGCGKTTLVSVVVGLLKLDQGEVKVLGGIPGEKNSGVPGPRVGFMPQDAALVDEFTVEGAIFYFGWLFNMKNADIKQRYEFLSDLLDLPPGNRMINTLSGGQLRRVSFAAAVVHSPELLILDEPTVGLDPILRHNLWKYFIKLSRELNVTILLTTHYIEEAKEADKVALLRNGHLLAATSPSILLNRFQTESMEEVFLILSKKQTDSKQIAPINTDDQQPAGTSEGPDVSYSATDESLHFNDFVSTHNKVDYIKHKTSSPARVKAIMYKNLTKIARNKAGMVFMFVYPIIFLLCFYFAVGNTPEGLPIGIVNDELGNCDNLPGGLKEYSSVELLSGDEDQICRFKGMSCMFLSRLKDKATKNFYYDTLPEAIDATERKRTFSTLHFQRNFTEALQARHDDPFSGDNSTIDTGFIRIWMDMAEYTIGYTLKLHFLDQFKDLSEYIAKQCNLTAKYNALPMKFEDPIYGRKNITFNEFMVPGMHLGTVYYMCMFLTATLIIHERIEGVWDRNIVAGVTEAEIVFCQLLSELTITVGQLTELLILAYFGFNVRVLGSAVAAVVLLFLQALVGSSTGLFLSVSLPTNTAVIYATTGLFFHYMMLSGYLWPLEGMYTWVRYMSYWIPGAWPTIALKNIMYRGWSVTHSEVYPGYLVAAGWFILMMTSCILFLKISRR